MNYRQDSGADTELVFGIVGPIGCNRDLVTKNIGDLAAKYSYNTVVIKISDLITELGNIKRHGANEYDRVIALMDGGNKLRKRDCAILAKRAAVEIARKRNSQNGTRTIFIIDSLKHQAEIKELRNIYGRGFYLFAVHSLEESRKSYLENHCHILSEEKREILIKRDESDAGSHAQSTMDAFHLADFFLTENGNSPKVYNSLQRFMDIIFADPFRTPTFHEYAMYIAHTAAMRSADLSRQVGSVITRSTDIIATGANECPKAGGGSYWPLFDDEKNLIYDVDGGRDYKLGYDFNAKEKDRLVAAIKHEVASQILNLDATKAKIAKQKLNPVLKRLSKLVSEQLEANIKNSGLLDLTEFGRVVHAEMDAILGCARRGISCKDAVLFCTTFPCHNCAKHIVASGIKSVIYIEPYPKSKAAVMHADSIAVGDSCDVGKVSFVPFVGVGPRQFVNLFSLSLSYGAPIKRKKEKSAEKASYDRSSASPRVKMFDVSYSQIEGFLEREHQFSEKSQ